ncbi:VpsF family polysaccharide biosynthesis protein [Bradyrhizobium sp. CSA112]|uniref:VpsF family polysaccharide biosynthesis protein n=1 Tax=Bradyrhizobium sp. CSA112 TaxID=2699170 RepID=UPI0023B1DE1E|nr:VpsF family polysaccharide biosynthesis protein [Bradyrhizobium sp. CSA112]
MRARGPLNGSTGVAQAHRRPLALAAPRPASHARGRITNADAFIEQIAACLMLLAVMATFTISSSVLTNFKIHYLTAGGNFYEKLHPATYFTLLAFSFLLIRSRGPIGEINRMFSESKLLLAYLLCWLFLLIQVFVLERPFTVIIDTFLLPILIAMVMWQLPGAQKRALVWAIHLTILLNVVLGYYEYFSGHRLIPLTLGDVLVAGEWRSAALLGHPLTASGVVGAYVLALVLRPAICPPLLVRLPLIAFCLGSLMAFGGRTSLVTVLAMIGLVGGFEAFRLMRGRRMPLPAAILAICVLFAAGAIIFAALDLGIFDKMLLRFSSDKGSALARFATFNLLSHFDWHELILGPNPVRVNALQAQLGLNYGIENFWIASIVQFGLVHTIVLTIGLVCFFVELLRRSSGAVWAIVLLIVVIAASSVSFSSKNIQLAQFVILISVLLPREQRRVAAPQHVRNPVSYRSVPA